MVLFFSNHTYTGLAAQALALGISTLQEPPINIERLVDCYFKHMVQWQIVTGLPSHTAEFVINRSPYGDWYADGLDIARSKRETKKRFCCAQQK